MVEYVSMISIHMQWKKKEFQQALYTKINRTKKKGLRIYFLLSVFGIFNIFFFFRWLSVVKRRQLTSNWMIFKETNWDWMFYFILCIRNRKDHHNNSNQQSEKKNEEKNKILFQLFSFYGYFYYSLWTSK